MKKLIFILVFGFFGVVGFSQELKPEQVPQLIKNRVQFKFPQAMDLPIAWSKENGEYKAVLTVMDTLALIVVDSLGKIKRIERRVHESYLPEKATKYLKSLDSKCEFVSVIQVTDEMEKVTYKTVARIKTDFTFDGKGNLTGKK